MKRTRRVAGFVVATSALSGCWLQPRFDAGQTGYNPHESSITSENVADLTGLWDTRIGDQPVSTPISRRGTVYATSDDAEGTAAALDAATGEVRWLVEGLGEDPDYPGSPSLGPVLHHDDTLFVIVERAGNRSQRLRLDPATGEIVEAWGSNAGQMAVQDGELAHRDSLFAPDTIWHSVTWKPDRRPMPFVSGGNTGSFAIVADWILWSADNRATGYSEDCPQPIEGYNVCGADWSTDLGARPGQPVAVGAHHVAYPAGGSLHVLDVLTGEVAWTAAAAGPLAVAGETIFAVDNGTDRLVALAAAGCGQATCDPLWEASLSGDAFPPTVGGDVVYVLTDTGDLLAFPRDGCGAASCEPLVTLATGESFVSGGGPVVMGGRVLATTTDGRVIAYGLPN